RFAKENVLDDQKIELLKTLFYVVQVGIAHHRVFANDIEALDAALGSGVNYFDKGQTGFFGDCINTPGCREFLAHFWIGYLLVGGQDVWQAAHVACALDVVLPPQWIYAPRLNPDVAAQHGQIGYAFDRVGAVYVLGYPHRIGDRGGRGLRIEPGRAYKFVLVNSGDFTYFFRRVG